jgi:7,8-dihydropterin-6-yl-methyl-4-(beta-D-ribofuranosyl)aminobenzene 5'-phosphate synthase
MAENSLPDGVVELDELTILVVVDNETDTLSSIDEGVPQVPEVAHLLAATPAGRVHEGHDCKTVFDQLCCACHGFSALATARRGTERHTMLFDVGPYPDLWLDNAARLGINLAAIECIFLSHWHFDHSGGFPQVVAAIAEARSRAGLGPPIVDLHPNRPDQRGLLLPNGMMAMLPDEPSFADIAAAGGAVVKHHDPHPVCDGFLFASGAIDRVTDYETGLVGHHSFSWTSVSSPPACAVGA